MEKEILLADDEAVFRESMEAVLNDEGLKVTSVSNGLDAIREVQNKQFAIAILDIRMPGADGIKVLNEIRKKSPQTHVIMITAYGSVEMAVEAIKLGASDYVMKPILFDDILAKIRRQLQMQKLEAENVELKEEISSKFGVNKIIGQSNAIRSVVDTINKVSNTKSNVLIIGESGTGKELVAQAIHSIGVTRKGHFVAINCGAIPEQLLESELFGHKKGSFTSADSDKVGLFEKANGGTLFLDEIGHMPINCQVKLLRAIEEKKILPVGSTEPVHFDLRLIAAMNQDPMDEIREGRFREDLYYRLNVVGIYLPSLKERREDIPLLVEHFIRKYNQQMGKHIRHISSQAMQMLTDHVWKGNIRELQNAIERAIIFADGDTIKPSDIGLIGPGISSVSLENENLHDFLMNCEREHILRVLDKYGGDKVEAAKAMGIGLSSLYRKIEQLSVGKEKPVKNSNTKSGDKNVISYDSSNSLSA